MTDTKYATAQFQDRRVTTHNFGVFDTKGREIGTRIETSWVDVVPHDGTEPRWQGSLRLPVGRHYAFEPHSTRDGKLFGALQRPQFFASENERDAAVNAYIERARKRALKNAAKAAA
jgi:hypothetical protein